MPAKAFSQEPASVEDGPLPGTFHLDRKLPVGEQVYAALREAIVTIRLLPGASISENRICRHFGVSRTPARAAVLRLVEEGLIDVYPQQGSFVAPIRMSSIENDRFVRRSLEISILREAATCWTSQKSAECHAAIARQGQAIADGETDAFYREDLRFHHIFATCAGREGVWAVILGAMAGLGRVHRLCGKPERLPVVLEEHEAIVEALDAGDAKAAIHRLEYHLDKIFHMLEQVPNQYSPYVTD